MAIDRSSTGENSDANDDAETHEVSETSETSETQLASEQTEDPAAAAASRELSEELPVPAAMWPSEIDERARVVEALEDEHRADERLEPRRDDGGPRS